MTQQTHLGNTIDAVDPNKVLYDKNVKELLADVQILARILKYTVAEVRELEIDEIISCIDTDSIAVGTIPITPGLTNAMRVQSVQTEDSVLHESYITFDIRLSLTYGKKSVRIIINLEAQKSADVGKLGYHLENRIIYYMARLVSSQKGTEFFHSDYDNLRIQIMILSKKYTVSGSAWMETKSRYGKCRWCRRRYMVISRGT